MLGWLSELVDGLSDRQGERPVEHIRSRIKSADGMREKLARKDLSQDVETAVESISDIIGFRLVTHFVGDVYELVKSMKTDSRYPVVKEKDYIASPKPNGYRSFHMILGIQVYSMESTEYYPVEVQIRTIGMDFWASMEHRISYKKERADKEQLKDELREYANMLVEIEGRFEQYNETDHQLEKHQSK